jgi:hypothetical protein
MALPDFQRDFVWDPFATDELIESIINNYPAGTLLRIKNGHQLLFRPRAFQGAPALDEKRPTPAYLILDGQQRLTSLYQAFYGAGDHRYYLNLAGLEKGDDLEDCAFYLKAEEALRQYGAIDQQATHLVLPLSTLFGVTGGFSAWQNKVLKVVGIDVPTMLDLQERLSRLHDRWIKPIEEYDFPMVDLNEDTSGPAVCMIFETLNRTGVKLSVFDLLTARFWPDDYNLREKWEAAKGQFSILGEFGIDPYYMLQIIALLEPGVDKEGNLRAPSIKRGIILDMKVDQARRGWDRAMSGLVDALTVVRDDCGVLLPSLLPYNTIIIPMAAAFASQTNHNSVSIGVNRIKITRWFWCSVFGQKYENAPNSQAEKDYAELQRWMAGGDPPESVRGFKFDMNLRQVSPRQRAVYRGIMALILRHGAMDFHKRGKITTLLLGDKKNPVDDHHVFPRAFLDSQSIQVGLRDCILNRTFIDRETNQRLGKRAPSDYMEELRKEQGEKYFDELLCSHLLPGEDSSPLLNDRFDAFLDRRELMLKALIAHHTQE